MVVGGWLVLEMQTQVFLTGACAREVYGIGERLADQRTDAMVI